MVFLKSSGRVELALYQLVLSHAYSPPQPIFTIMDDLHLHNITAKLTNLHTLAG